MEWGWESYDYPDVDVFWSGFMFSHQPSEYEVIGNIYENPELLKA